MINNRQAGRRRGRNGGGGNNGGQRPGGQGRPDNGNRIDSRARGNASQLYEKYKNLAADSQRQGDRVNTEYYLQFADHYFRVLSDQRGRVEEQQPRRQQPDFDIDGNDEFYGDEGEPIRAGEQGEAQQRADRGNGNDRGDRQQQYGQDRQNQDRPNQDRQPRRWDRDGSNGEEGGDDGYRAERQPRRDEGNRQERQGQDRQNQNGQERQPRRWDRERAPEQANGAETEIAGQRRADPPVPGENLAARAEAVLEADAPLPRRRGRPRREPAMDTAPAAESASETDGVDADRLPPSLSASIAVPANDADGDEPRPRRRRTRTATAGEATSD